MNFIHILIPNFAGHSTMKHNKSYSPKLIYISLCSEQMYTPSVALNELKTESEKIWHVPVPFSLSTWTCRMLHGRSGLHYQQNIYIYRPIALNQLKTESEKNIHNKSQYLSLCQREQAVCFMAGPALSTEYLWSYKQQQKWILYRQVQVPSPSR